MVFEFDIDDLVLQAKNTILSDLAEGSTISVERVQPKLQPHYGLQGATGVARNGVDATKVSFQVIANSPNCRFLVDIAERGELFPFSYVNMNENGKTYAHSKCFMEEVPTVELGGEIGGADVTITMPLGG